MIEAVLLFGALNVLFEFVLLSMLPPRYRLRLLGSPHACGLLHVSFLLLNLIIHWGTLIGSMASILAFVSSIVTVEVARRLFGQIKAGRYYTVGFFKYPIGEIL
jgi:hypothetical protein